MRQHRPHELPSSYRLATLGRSGAGVLPRGWFDLALQALLWFGFVVSYEFARGLVDHDRSPALAHGRRIVELEQRLFRPLPEQRLQRFVDSSHWLRDVAAWTYWNSEFTVVVLALIWVYLRRNDYFNLLRNSLVLASVVALAGFALYPTAPPRMFPALGFRDTLASIGSVNHGAGLVEIASNPYAAMPSLHSADALIVAIVLAASCRRSWSKALWLAWPVWVWLCVMATANHFLLDVVAGIALASVTFAVVALGAGLGKDRVGSC